ncbi:MAG TPA: choice-of-anchor B family protein, partial [Saprospiraceae bacterium]|nr:choice-of-anchor B family protein [Saprospiraceae bacterium]
CLAASILPAQNHNLQLRSKLDFPGQTLANICGYWQDGREYALVGGSKGLIIIEVTDPAKPTTIVQIPGPDNLWKEIKVYQHYAYVTSEGGSGVQIVDLKGLPSATLPNHYYKGSGAIAGTLNRIHALHIDVTKGYLYTYGSQDSGPNGSEGALVHDLNADPYNPSYVGQFSQLGYIHDGYVDNDTLYACHINIGQMSMVDMRTKTAPKLLGAVETPSKFTHNSWMLSDRKTVLTTDERVPSFLTAYDVSDPTDIRELDRIATTPSGTTSIGHNTHILKDWAITSWYSDGFTIVDAHRPENLVEVGRYDTWAPPLAGDYFVGCWGVFPYFPSGTIVASNIEPAEFFVLTPDYV